MVQPTRWRMQDRHRRCGLRRRSDITELCPWPARDWSYDALLDAARSTEVMRHRGAGVGGDVASTRLITSLIKGAQARAGSIRARGLGGRVLAKVRIPRGYEFCTQSTLRAAPLTRPRTGHRADCGRRARPGRHASDQRVPLLWGQVGPKKCAQTEDCRIFDWCRPARSYLTRV